MMKDLNIYLHKKITLEQAVCGGNFIIQLNTGRTVKILLKPGVMDGHKIRLKNHGLVSDDGSQKGDAFITLNVLEHPFFKVDGLDIKSDFVISPAEAVNGIVKKLPGPDGKKMVIRVPPNTKDGDIVTVKGAGLNVNDKKGDMHFHIRIENIDELNEFFMSSLLNQTAKLLN